MMRIIKILAGEYGWVYNTHDAGDKGDPGPGECVHNATDARIAKGGHSVRVHLGMGVGTGPRCVAD
jgi:hypothetical protein